MAIRQPAAAAIMKNEHEKCEPSEEMQSSEKNESFHPDNSNSAERIEEQKGINIMMARIDESEPLSEESE